MNLRAEWLEQEIELRIKEKEQIMTTMFAEIKYLKNQLEEQKEKTKQAESSWDLCSTLLCLIIFGSPLILLWLAYLR